MKSVLRKARMALATGAVLVALTATGAVMGPVASASTLVVTPAIGVNVRSGPGIQHRVLGALPRGTQVDARGDSQNGWTPVNYRGQEAWISSEYLSNGGSGGGSNDRPSNDGAEGVRRTTANLHIRTGPSIRDRSLTVVRKGTELRLTGKVTNDYSEVEYQGQKRWAATRYLSGASGPSTPPSDPNPGENPAVTGVRYATVALDIRSTSANNYRRIAEVPTGTKLEITGRVENGRMQIIYKGAPRWVTAKYLSENEPSTGGGGDNFNPGAKVPYHSSHNGLTAKSKGVMADVYSHFQQFTTIYGYRNGSGSDHGSGRAIDFMLPAPYLGNQQLGWAVANYARDNASRLGIDYVIFAQKIWSQQRSREGWRAMADRGSDNANHYNHVHISVRP